MFNNLTNAVKAIILINIAMYIGTTVIAEDLYYDFALFFYEHPLFKPWQVLTHMFMHDNNSIFHLFFNMYALFLFGPALENWMGTAKFWIFYLSCGIGAYLLTTGIDLVSYYNQLAELMAQGASESAAQNILFTPSSSNSFSVPMVGASGCIFGVMAGFALLYPNVSFFLLFIPFPIKAKYLIGAYVLYETLSVLGVLQLQANVGHAAHLGGAIIGFILVFLWKRNDMNKYRID